MKGEALLWCYFVCVRLMNTHTLTHTCTITWPNTNTMPPHTKTLLHLGHFLSSLWRFVVWCSSVEVWNAAVRVGRVTQKARTITLPQPCLTMSPKCFLSLAFSSKSNCWFSLIIVDAWNANLDRRSFMFIYIFPIKIKRWIFSWSGFDQHVWKMLVKVLFSCFYFSSTGGLSPDQLSPQHPLGSQTPPPPEGSRSEVWWIHFQCGNQREQNLGGDTRLFVSTAAGISKTHFMVTPTWKVFEFANRNEQNYQS